MTYFLILAGICFTAMTAVFVVMAYLHIKDTFRKIRRMDKHYKNRED